MKILRRGEDNMTDNVNKPKHYTQGNVECIDAIESATIGLTGIVAVCVANIIKYVWRFGRKNGIEDLDKADYYLQRARTLIRNKETKGTAFEGLQEELQQQEKDRYFKMCIDSEEDKKDSKVTYNPTRRLKGLS